MHSTTVVYLIFAEIAIWMSLCLGVVILVWAADEYIFKRTLQRTTLGDAGFSLCSVAFPWAFGLYAVAFAVRGLMTLLELQISITIGG